MTLTVVAALLAGLAACGGGADQVTATSAIPPGTTEIHGTVAPLASRQPVALGDTAPGVRDPYKTSDPYFRPQVHSAPPRTIVMTEFEFLPTDVTAKPGETWTEDNEDVALHNIQTVGKNPEEMVSPDVLPGQKATFKMPTKPGKYFMVCIYHQYMVVRVTIKK
jgi:plastocyanin